MVGADCSIGFGSIAGSGCIGTVDFGCYTAGADCSADFDMDMMDSDKKPARVAEEQGGTKTFWQALRRGRPAERDDQINLQESACISWLILPVASPKSLTSSIA